MIAAIASLTAGYYFTQTDSKIDSTQAKNISKHTVTQRPDFSLYNLEDQLRHIKEWDGQVVMVNFWATWCPPCRSEMPAFQQLYDDYKDKGLIVIGVPSNQFGGQEPGTESEIKDFCETNFNITFPITSKYDVKGSNAHPIYLWAKETYGKSAVPKWNFHKILINKEGRIEDTYLSFTNPLSNKIKKKLEQIL